MNYIDSIVYFSIAVVFILAIYAAKNGNKPIPSLKNSGQLYEYVITIVIKNQNIHAFSLYSNEKYSSINELLEAAKVYEQRGKERILCLVENETTIEVKENSIILLKMNCREN